MGESSTYPLIELMVRRSRLPKFWFITIVASLLMLFLILAQYLDGVSNDLLGWRFWQNNLEGLALIIYILVVYSFMWQLREKAIQNFRLLLTINNDEFDRLAKKIATPKRRWEWASLLIGIAFSCALGAPWDLGWGPGEYWMSIYMSITSVVMFGLLFWLIYDTLAGALRLSRLCRFNLKLDIFDNELLTPVARWSLGISFAFIGGISLSLILGPTSLESLRSWQSITIYAILVGVTAMIFFLSMWSFHGAMVDAKKRKLSIAQKHLIQISRELEEGTPQDRVIEMRDISNEINSWASYRKLVQEAPTWPYNTSIIRRLFASMIVPAIVYLIRILSGLGFRP